MPRSLEQIKQSSGTLSGADSQMLRAFCTSEYMQPARDLNDDYGRLLQNPDPAPLKNHFNERLQALSNDHSAAVRELSEVKWGPTKIPVYNVLLSFIYMNPHLRSGYLTVAEWLVKTAKVPVDGTDLSGTTALMHAISTKPYLDIQFAQMLLDNGADINHRNRYGGIAAEEIVKVQQFDAATVERSGKALKWFLENGGDVSIKDGDGISARFMIDRLQPVAPQLKTVLMHFEQNKAPVNTSNSDQKAVKTGRNDPCSCGSSKKFKKCCG